MLDWSSITVSSHVIFRYHLPLKVKEKKFDLAIFQVDTIFPRILTICRTELSLYSVLSELNYAYTQNVRNWVKPILNMRGTKLSLYSVCSEPQQHLKFLSGCLVLKIIF